MIKALIVEDEINSQELLQNLLNDFCKNIEVCAIADSVIDGINQIKIHKPDIVFLDYQIQGGNSFDILDSFNNYNFKVIFITGYSEYAIKAIKYSALDYLLKPVNSEELVSAVNRFDPNVINYNKNIEFLKKEIINKDDISKQILIPDKNDHKVINLNEIAFIKAMQSYVEFYLLQNKKLISSYPLKYYEELLPRNHFFKSHKSYILNMKMIKSVGRGRGGTVNLYTGHEIPIATRRKSFFLRILKEL